MMGAAISTKTKRRRAQRKEVATSGVYRGLALAARSVNTEQRTVEAVITTETPVMEFDYERWEMVPRVLLTSGVQFPSSRQIPLLDSHNRNVMENQLGSARSITKEANGVSGVLHFSGTAERQWELVREGHATDVSAGFQVIAETYVPEGTTQRIDGKDFTGPINVATAWRLFEVSLTPIGADEQAKLRGFDPTGNPQQIDEGFKMKTELREKCIARGMPADLDDNAALEWWEADLDKRSKETHHTAPNSVNADELMRQLDAAAVKREEERAAKVKAFRADVTAMCELADMPDFTSRCLDLPTLEEVRTAIKNEKAERAKKNQPTPGYGIKVTGEGRDAFRNDIVTNIVNRMAMSATTKEQIIPTAERGKGADKFNRATISEIARECLVMDGYRHEDVRWLSRSDVATAVFSSPEQVGLTRYEQRDSGPYHTTGSFAYLTENAMNKGLRAGYSEATSTWEKVMSTGTPVADFKPKRLYITSAVGNLTAWPDGEEPDLASFQDYRDSYGVEAYAKGLEFSWQLLVNDDLGALTKAPMKLGMAARRTVNAYAWSLVTANATMADGQALFLATPAGNRKKANYISSGVAVTVASITALETLMLLQVGQNTREGNAGPDILGNANRAKYLVTPAAIRNTAAAVIRSIADPASSNSNVHNPYQNTLELITEPLLDANSATAWYLVADPNVTECVEISFMQGHETPVMWSGMDEKTLTRWFAIRQVFGGKFFDHRGWAKQAGA